MADQIKLKSNFNSQENDVQLISKKVSLVLKQFNLLKENTGHNRQVVEKLNDSNKGIEQKLKLLKSSANCKKDREQLQNIIKLVEQTEGLEHQLKLEKSYIKDLEMKICKEDAKTSVVWKQKSKSRRDLLNFQLDKTKINKYIDISKEKLHAASVQLSSESTKNSELREKIKSLMCERKFFNKDYNNLIGKLQKGKTVLENLYVSIKQAERARQNIMNKIEKIQSKESKQKKVQEEEAFELEMRLDNENECQDYYLTKLKSREKIEDKFKTARRTTVFKRQSMLRTNIELLSNISVFYGSEPYVIRGDLIKLVKRDNCEIGQLFKFVTQQRDELESLQEKVFSLVQEVEEKLNEYDDNKFLQEQCMIELERRKQSQTESEFYITDDLVRCSHDINKVYKGIKDLVGICKADVSPLLHLLGDNSKVTEFNVQLFLQALESRINSLIDAAALGSKTSSLDTSDTSQPPRKYETGEATLIGEGVIISSSCPACYPSSQMRKSTFGIE